MPAERSETKYSYIPKQIATLSVMVLLSLIAAAIFRGRLLEANMYQEDIAAISSLSQVSNLLVSDFDLGEYFLGFNSFEVDPQPSNFKSVEELAFEGFNAWLQEEQPEAAKHKAKARTIVQNWLHKFGLPQNQSLFYLQGKTAVSSINSPAMQQNQIGDWRDKAVPYCFFSLAGLGNTSSEYADSQLGLRIRFNEVTMLDDSQLDDLIFIAKKLRDKSAVFVVESITEESLPELDYELAYPDNTGLNESFSFSLGAQPIPSVASPDDSSISVPQSSKDSLSMTNGKLPQVTAERAILKSIVLEGNELVVSLRIPSESAPRLVKIPVESRRIDSFSPIQLFGNPAVTNKLLSITSDEFERLDQRYSGLSVSQAAEVAAAKVSTSFEDIELLGVKISQNWFWAYLGVTLSILLTASFWQFQVQHDSDDEVDTFLLRHLMQNSYFRFLIWVVVPVAAMLLACPVTNRTTILGYVFFFVGVAALLAYGLFIYRRIASKLKVMEGS